MRADRCVGEGVQGLMGLLGFAACG